jgi:hypothetical protein
VSVQSVWHVSQMSQELPLHVVIESITTNRDEQPGFEAMYMLMPTSENVQRVIRDFDGRKQYAAAHLFFIEGEATYV